MIIMEKLTTHIKRAEDTIKIQAQLVTILPELAKGRTFDCTIEKHRERRSLDANAYFHLLIDKMAKVLKCGTTELKIKMNLEYGSPALMSNGMKFAIKVPKGEDITRFYNYAKWYGEATENGVVLDKYMLYKPTHTLNSKEMAFLIDRVIDEAKDLGVDTITPNEKAKMISLWESKNEIYNTKK